MRTAPFCSRREAEVVLLARRVDMDTSFWSVFDSEAHLNGMAPMTAWGVTVTSVLRFIVAS
jgi:hypothetical protein